MTRQEATEFYRTHSKALYNTALRIVRDPAEAEEIMQMGIDALRRRKKALTVVDDIPFDEVEEEVEIPGEMDILRIREAMERLPHPYGLILDLVLIEGMDYAGISRMTGQKETTLRSWYSRGRAKLVKELKTSMI